MSSLRQVLLVYLGSGAASGYDIVKGFQKTYGHLWKATWQQVYRDLNKLREDGLVEQEVVASGKRPPRKASTTQDEPIWRASSRSPRNPRASTMRSW